jgi:hypothetical protein
MVCFFFFRVGRTARKEAYEKTEEKKRTEVYGR